MRIKSTEKLSGNWWYIVRDANDKRLLDVGVPVSNYDFDKYNLVITDGREIKDMHFVRSNQFPYRNTHFAKVVLKNEFNSHTWYIYKMNKMEVYIDGRYKDGNIEIEKL